MEEQVTFDEHDYIMELITAIMFMIVGIVGIVFMINQLSARTEVESRVDKVRVSAIDQSDADPFYFTGYQAYMFSWMMDGHDKTALYWFGEPSAKITAPDVVGDENWIGLMPAKYANGFIVLRNRAIVGSTEYANMSVKQTLYKAAGDNEDELVKLYRGIGTDDRFHLEFSDIHTDYWIEEYLDEDHVNLFEKRKDYVWMLHKCNH